MARRALVPCLCVRTSCSGIPVGLRLFWYMFSLFHRVLGFSIEAGALCLSFLFIFSVGGLVRGLDRDLSPPCVFPPWAGVRSCWVRWQQLLLNSIGGRVMLPIITGRTRRRRRFRSRGMGITNMLSPMTP